MRRAISGSRARGSSAGSISTRARLPWWRTRSWRKPRARSRSSPASTWASRSRCHLGAVGEPRRQARRGRQVRRRQPRGAGERADLRLAEADVEEGREHAALVRRAVAGAEVAEVVGVHAVGDGGEAELVAHPRRAPRTARSCSGSSGPGGWRGSRRSPSPACRRSGARGRSRAPPPPRPGGGSPGTRATPPSRRGHARRARGAPRAPGSSSRRPPRTPRAGSRRRAGAPRGQPLSAGVPGGWRTRAEGTTMLSRVQGEGA